MRYKYLLAVVISIVLLCCKRNKIDDKPSPPAQPKPLVLLKEIAIPFLPSPYYHFEYDSLDRVNFVSFASDLTRYDVVYQGDNIREMRNNILVNKDRLQYFYDNNGRVSNINYADSNGIVFTRVFLTYEGTRLTKLEREVKSAAGFILDKRMIFSYYADGNLMEVSTHRPMINGSSEQNSTDRYQLYDNKLNVDDFQLLHSEFFDHFVYLPKLQLQKNNERMIIHTGDNADYQIEYSYIYDSNNAPLQKKGNGKWLSGPMTGQSFDFKYFYSYY